MFKKSVVRTGLLLVSLVGMLLPAMAQEAAKPTVYTYVSEWSVPRAQWGEMEKNADAERPLLDKLVADGTITGYGSYSYLIHTEGEPTHGTWFSASSEGNLLKTLEAIYAQPQLVTNSAQAASKHWDHLFQSTIYNGRPGKGGYLTISRWQLKPGQMRSYNQLTKATLNPVLDKLVADGTITAYGTDTDDYHTGPMGVIWEYIIAPDAASLDKANKAIEDTLNSTPAVGDAFRAMFEIEGHRDNIARLRFMGGK